MFKKIPEISPKPHPDIWIHRHIRPWQWGHFHPHKNLKTRTVQIRLHREQQEVGGKLQQPAKLPSGLCILTPYSAGLLISKSVTEFEGRVLICEL